VERFIKGDIVVIPFPYSDLSNAKKRPALVLAESSLGDLILCQITSQEIKDSSSIPLSNDEFTHGSLNKISNIRPNKLFTADSKIILYKIGSLKSQKINHIIDKIIEIFKN
jgi:mRNA interferase MazF